MVVLLPLCERLGIREMEYYFLRLVKYIWQCDFQQEILSSKFKMWIHSSEDWAGLDIIILQLSDGESVEGEERGFLSWSQIT